MVGAAVGAVIGARLFALLGGDDPSWLLAVLFVPTFGFVAGFLAQRMGNKFLRWATAIAGAALILSAVGSMFSDDLGLLQTPDGAGAVDPAHPRVGRARDRRPPSPARAGAWEGRRVEAGAGGKCMCKASAYAEVIRYDGQPAGPRESPKRRCNWDFFTVLRA